VCRLWLSRLRLRRRSPVAFAEPGHGRMTITRVWFVAVRFARVVTRGDAVSARTPLRPCGPAGGRNVTPRVSARDWRAGRGLPSVARTRRPCRRSSRRTARRSGVGQAVLRDLGERCPDRRRSRRGAYAARPPDHSSGMRASRRDDAGRGRRHAHGRPVRSFRRSPRPAPTTRVPSRPCPRNSDQSQTASNATATNSVAITSIIQAYVAPRYGSITGFDPQARSLTNSRRMLSASSLCGPLRGFSARLPFVSMDGQPKRAASMARPGPKPRATQGLGAFAWRS
jgi:hypothetical protein